ncbi:MAG: GLPGLI family protein [Bacteroidetes bacterium]|nr:GLPGLI family protein [Bacteroidota bacterium]
MKTRDSFCVSLCFILTLSFASLFSQNRKVEVVYKANVARKENNQKQSKFTSKTDKLFEAMSDIEMILYYDKGKGVFQVADALSSSDKKDNLEFNLATILLDVSDDYFYNTQMNEVVVLKKDLGTDFHVVYTLNRFDWTLGSQTKEISGIKCYRATAANYFYDKNNKKQKIEVVAWFAPSVNVPLGPIGYSGLPGLILELEEVGRRRYFATNIFFDANFEIANLYEVKKGDRISEMDYNALLKSKYEHFHNLLKN